MLKVPISLIILIFVNCNYIYGKLPLISYERRIEHKIIEGDCSTIHISTGNKDLAIGNNEIRIKNKDFKFNKSIKTLLVKYNFRYGDCIECGSVNFDEIIKYPFKIEIDPITKDSLELLGVNNKTIQYRMNNIVSSINQNDSLSFSNDKIDTSYNLYNGKRQRLILLRKYKTTVKFKTILNLKTMKYITEPTDKSKTVYFDRHINQKNYKPKKRGEK